MASNQMYTPELYGDNEVKMMSKYHLQVDDAKNYFTAIIKPRLDRSYKLYIADNTDRAKEIDRWQANIAVPYIQGVVETLKPRILDARPDFSVQGRNEEDQAKSSRVQSLNDYTWEISKADKTAELVTSSSLIYGTGFLQVSWKKDVRTQKFLQTKDLSKNKYVWKDKEQVFYDAPYVECVDNYDLWYDWHNTDRESKQYWFKRRVLTGAEIKRRYTMADKKRLKMALEKPGGDLTNFGSVRTDVKLTQEKITKGADYGKSGSGLANDQFDSSADPDTQMYEVFEWTRPFEDKYAVMVNEVPILKGGAIPIIYNFKESQFIEIPYLRIPGEFEGYGIPMILENPQIMLNMIKNQRLDATTLNIHKMWVVNPLANIDKKELVTRPFGIIYSTDPNGAREIQMADVGASAYKEEESLKSDMRYGSGVDDFSMGIGGAAGSATETRQLRESTLERVRLFVNHLGEAYSDVMRYWISMYSQFWTKEMQIRIVGENGAVEFPFIEKDDLVGQFDFKAAVIPSIAGQNDVQKKQDMDLFQLLIEMEFIDPEKLTSKMLHDWNWDLESIRKEEQPQIPGMPGMPGMPGEVPPEGAPGMPQPQQGAPQTGGVSNKIARDALAMLGDQSQFAEASSPINLLQAGAPPTAKGIPAPSKGANPRGLNRGGKVNTNIAQKAPNGPSAQINQQARNIQR